MKATITTERIPVEPPKVLLLELSETEARALYWSLTPSTARGYWQEIGAEDEDEARDLAYGIELAIDEAFDAEGLKIDLN